LILFKEIKMVYFRDVNQKVWWIHLSYNFRMRRMDLDDAIDYVYDANEKLILYKDGTFCGIPNVVKIGKLLTEIFCLDSNGILYKGNSVSLVNVEDFWVWGNHLLIKQDTYYLYGSDLPIEAPKGDILGFKLTDLGIVYRYKYFDQQVRQGVEIGINKEGKLEGINVYVPPLSARFLRKQHGTSYVFLEDGSLYYIEYLSDKIVLKLITNEICYPLNYIRGTKTKSARFF
jgi:hypothetical protein